jgi:hypothetical protein
LFLNEHTIILRGITIHHRPPFAKILTVFDILIYNPIHSHDGKSAEAEEIAYDFIIEGDCEEVCRFFVGRSDSSFFDEALDV